MKIMIDDFNNGAIQLAIVQHILAQLYVEYSGSIYQILIQHFFINALFFQGYKEEIEKPENQHVLPAALVGQADVLFGNLHELFTFHQDVFLKDLERSISATELVALCFVEKVRNDSLSFPCVAVKNCRYMLFYKFPFF